MHKQRLIEVVDAGEITKLNEDIGAPNVFSNRVGNRVHFWANADELRAWRGLQNTSASEQET